MDSRPNFSEPPAPAKPTQLRKDIWLAGASVAVLAVYAALFFIRPSGEGWGRGWNMVAFLIYAAPTSLLAGALAAWRSGKVAGQAQTMARLVTTAGLLFPLICAVVIKAKA